MASTISEHVIFATMPSWGHTRPIVPVVFKMVQERPSVLISVAVIGSFKEKMDQEVARYCSGSNAVLRDNIRIIQLSDFQGTELQCWDKLPTLWPGFVAKLWASEPITCFTGRVYPSAPRPSLCIMDMFLGAKFNHRLHYGKELKVMLWNCGGVSATLAFIGPYEYGGGYGLEENAKVYAEKMNISLSEAILDLRLNPVEKVARVPGLPPAYHYELRGRHLAPPAGIERFLSGLRGLIGFVRDCDGAIWGNSSLVEKEALKAIKDWFKDLGKPSYAVGPCVLPDLPIDPLDQGGIGKGQNILNFLDRIYESHGEHSLLYMSFGTVSFPDDKTAWQVINIILEMKVPFIFAVPHSDVYENQLPNDLRIRLETSDLALVAKWVPQQLILDHRATGAFITHCGQGSVMEALFAGVVIIGWPVQSDQPYNCMNLALNLKVAYQLLEVNTLLLPLYRGYQPIGTKEAIDREFRQVLKDAFGADGEAKRNILKDLSRKLRGAWREDSSGPGEALAELRRLLQDSFE